MKKLRFAGTLILAIFVLTFCADRPTEKTMESEYEEPEYLTLETISQEYMGYPLMIEEPMLRVIRTQEELSELWELPSSRIDKPEIPEIDFSRNMLLVAAMGEQPTSGYSIEITGAELKDDEWVFSVREAKPGESCMNLMVITTPHHMAVVPKSNKDVKFEVTTVTEECE